MRTPLHDRHAAMGARMVEFAGWQMPLHYGSILEEHRRTRTAASLFDTCHMSEFRVWGAWAEEALARALACRVRGLPVGRCRYGFLLNEAGGVVDDLICYRLAHEEFMVVANAGTRAKVARVLESRLGDRAVLDDLSDRTGKLDLQGPGSADALARASDASPAEMGYYWFAHVRVAGMEALVSRTGYTGELGFELYAPADRVADVWDALLAGSGVRPAGLGARDTLRLEMGYPLYGHELHEDVSPLEAGLEWALPARQAYMGAYALEGQRERGLGRRLVGVRFGGRRAARAGDRLLDGDAEVGAVTSGSFAPSLEVAVALAYVDPAHARPGTALEADVGGGRSGGRSGGRVGGRVVDLPFYRHGTARSAQRRKDAP